MFSAFTYGYRISVVSRLPEVFPSLILVLVSAFMPVALLSPHCSN